MKSKNFLNGAENMLTEKKQAKKRTTKDPNVKWYNGTIDKDIHDLLMYARSQQGETVEEFINSAIIERLDSLGHSQKLDEILRRSNLVQVN